MARRPCRRRRVTLARGVGRPGVDGRESGSETESAAFAFFSSSPGKTPPASRSVNASSSVSPMRSRSCACLSTKDSSCSPSNEPSPSSFASGFSTGGSMSGTHRAMSTSPCSPTEHSSFSPPLFCRGALASTSFSSACLRETSLAVTRLFSSQFSSASSGARRLGSLRNSSHAIASFPRGSRETSSTSRFTEGWYTARSTASFKPQRLGHSMAHT
mmetsp:Transcript_1208/g.4810  ORF Transcript_1208/g.4810 Transcript_1208/m.4810 type:complete len:215 (-) Transcript_1208:1447-2091(-)